MTRGALRFTEEQFRIHAGKSDRFKVGTDQRLAAPVLPAPTPPRVSGVGEAPTSGGLCRPYVTQVGKKYRNKPTNGYASIKESKRAFQLKLMQEAGQIRNLREQVSYLLIPKQDGERACSYVADFVYEEWGIHGSRCVNPYQWWKPIVEDCKGMRTDIYRLKRKLMLMVHQIRIRET